MVSRMMVVQEGKKARGQGTFMKMILMLKPQVETKEGFVVKSSPMEIEEEEPNVCGAKLQSLESAEKESVFGCRSS